MFVCIEAGKFKQVIHVDYPFAQRCPFESAGSRLGEPKSTFESTSSKDGIVTNGTCRLHIQRDDVVNGALARNSKSPLLRIRLSLSRKVDELKS